MTVSTRPATVVAWALAGAAGATALASALVGDSADVPWDAVSFPVLFGIPGALIAAQVPRRPTGWLMLFIAACFAGNAMSLQLLTAGHGSAWLAWWAGRASAVLVPATLLLVLLLPDGRLPSARWRPLVWGVVSLQLLVVTVASLTPGPAAPDDDFPGGRLASPAGVLPQGWYAVLLDVIAPVLILPFLLGIAAVLHRLRHPGNDERPRVVSVLASLLVFVLLVTVPDLTWPDSSVWFHIAGVAVLCGGILDAVVRGTFERVHVAVSHALVYGLLTVAVLVSYVLLVALSTVVGASEDLAGPLTAAVALALLPARGVVQGVLRRTMYGDRGQPHVAFRRLSSSVAESDDLDGVLAGLACSIQASLRARWVEVGFRGSRALSGDPSLRALVDERVLDGGDGAGGSLRVGLAVGRRLRKDERALLSDLAAHAARSARVVCLAQDLAAARQELVESREEERFRLRRDLHDELGPVLAGLAMQLGSMPALVTSDSALASDRLCLLEGEARGALDRMRRISRDLRPPALDELGLVAAVVEVGRGLGMDVRTDGAVVEGLSPAVEMAAYRIAAEAVLNAHRHARVEAVELVFDVQADVLRIEVTDRGPGTGSAAEGVGVASMRTRAHELGGRVELTDAEGGGTTVRVVLPR